MSIDFVTMQIYLYSQRTADRRLKQSNELLQNMKLLKLYAWELAFLNKIKETRREEITFRFKAAMIRVISCEC